jgi:hypothetical protein
MRTSTDRILVTLLAHEGRSLAGPDAADRLTCATGWPILHCGSTTLRREHEGANTGSE